MESPLQQTKELCPFCDQKIPLYSDKGNEPCWQMHIMSRCKPDKGIYSCPFANCEYSTKKRSGMFDHLRTHSNKPFLKCLKCGVTAKHENSFKVHMRRKHSENFEIKRDTNTFHHRYSCD